VPVLYEARFDGSEAIRHYHVSIIRFYLDQAYEYSAQAKRDDEEGVLLASSVIGLMFSVMALEAFINEVAEDVFHEKELVDFTRLRRGYRCLAGESTVMAKLRILFDRRHGVAVNEELMTSIGYAISLRNNLTHYKLSELSGKHVLPPPGKVDGSDGEFMHVVDLTVEPETVIPPFIEKVTGGAAADAFNAVLNVIKEWGKLQGVIDSVPGLDRID